MKRLAKALLRRVGLQRIPRPLPLDYAGDRVFSDRYERARAATGMRIDGEQLRQRYYTLTQLLRNAPIDKGDVCELGCFRGLSSYQLAAQMQELGVTPRFHLFDSFAGLSDRQAEDAAQGAKHEAPSRALRLSCSLGDVQQHLRAFPFIEYYQGWIPDRFDEVKDRQFSFVHIDVCLYQPYRDSFQFFYPRLVPGGIMVFDDYGIGQFPGATKAVDECRSRVHPAFFLALPRGQAFLIKGTAVAGG